MKKPNKVVRSLKNRTEMDEMISSQLWKASKLAREVNSFTGLPVDELNSVAQSFLIKIWNNYNPDKGANFSTWVNRCLYYHILNYLRDNSRLVKMPRTYSEIYLKIRKEKKKNPQISTKALAKKLKLEEEAILTVLQAFSAQYIPIGVTDSDQNDNWSKGSDDTEYEIYKQRVNNDEDYSENTFFDSHIKKCLPVVQGLSDEEFNLLEDVLIKSRSYSYLKKKYKIIKKEPDILDFVEEIRNECNECLKSSSTETTIPKDLSQKDGLV